FYLVYRTPRCQPGQACAAPQTRRQRMNKAMLWIATVLVLAFALFPSYVGVLLGGGSSGGGTSSGGGSIAWGETSTVTFEISGMTCEGCAAALQSRLAKLPGVVRAEVCFATKTAKVVLDTNRTRLSDETLLKAIEQAGFRGTEICPGYSPAGGHAPIPRASGSGYRQITP
ncbi:MAG TPA: cation transporter, partial [Tepidisphaeraceae bacterium]|nr:cation transporter [Tepidisphaeraceae bacterium]